MPSKKSGKKVSPEKPAEPKEPFAADQADPGKVEEAKAQDQKTQSGKYGSTPVQPFEPRSQGGASGPASGADSEEETTWVELELRDEQDNPIGGERYEVELSDGTTASGTLNNEGFASVTGIPPGNCKIKFPDLDQAAWE
ncbi:MAG: hypothetical protein AB8B93_06000 [Pseudomonadales bacterium]